MLWEIALGIGSNLGNPLDYCTKAVEMIGEAVKIVKVSSWYRTEPQGFVDQGWFINGAVKGFVSFSPRHALEMCQDIERSLGRERTILWGPRTIDIDILFYGNLVLNEEDLVLPHKMLCQRRFALIPLMEVAPDWVHPIHKKSVKELLKGLFWKGQIVKKVKVR